MTRSWPLLALLLLAAPARAEPEPPGALDLSGARVLASPGWPGALRSFLPPGREVEPLALPLPAGPLLVLGLTASDPLARRVGEAELGWQPGEDLHGGYVVSAQRRGERPLALILAEDAAALAAARFELETFNPTGAPAEPRQVDVSKPDEQGGVRMAAGLRRVTPRWRTRGVAGLGPGESWLDVAAAHANRAWVPPDISDRDLALLDAHGVTPVGASECFAAGSPSVRLIAMAELQLSLRRMQQRGLRHFALRLGRLDPSSDGTHEAELLRSVVDSLRPGGLSELLLVLEEGRFSAWSKVALEDLLPDLGGLPEVRFGWRGPSGAPLRITRDDADRAAARVKAPMVLVDGWMAATSIEPPALPSLPRGRAEDLGQALDGVLYLPGPGSAGALAAAWAPPAESEAAPELADLMGACAIGARDGPTFLLESAACLEQTLTGRYADPPWLRGLPLRLRETAASLPGSEGLLLARLTTDPLTIDGRLDEAPWSQAAWQKVGGVELAAVSDGRRLVLGARISDADGATGAAIQLQMGSHGLTSDLVSLMPHHPPGTLIQAGAVEWAHDRRDGTRMLEMAFGHYALRGDPYPTRFFPFDIAVRQADGIHHLGLPGPTQDDALPRSMPGGLLVIR